MDCHLPWSHGHKEGLRQCDNGADKTKFISVFRSIYEADEKTAQNVSGCLPPCAYSKYNLVKMMLDREEFPVNQYTTTLSGIMVFVKEASYTVTQCYIIVLSCVLIDILLKDGEGGVEVRHS